MFLELPRSRARFVPPEDPPVLRYGVALLSSTVALLLTVYSPMVETRLLVFALAVMVSAWFGGWKPGLTTTAFCVLGDAYFFLPMQPSFRAFKDYMVHLALFVLVALLICAFNAALRSAQQALKASETNFRSLVVNAPYGICRSNADGQLVDANPALIAMLGFSGGDELLRRNLATDIYRDPEQRALLLECFTGRSFDKVEAEWTRQDGSAMVVRVSGRPIRDTAKTVSFELYAEDITEQRALEQQLRQSQKMEAVGRLAGGIAHDFNNLLMVISGYCEFLLQKLGPDPSLRGCAQEIANAADRATSLTRQLLAFSRKQMLTPKVLDLNAVVSENLKMLPRLIGEDIELATLPADALWKVKADPGQIEQVVMNLVVNARDAMPGGGKLTIETANVTLDDAYARRHPGVAPGEYVMLAISATGMGMDKDTQSHIFEPFFTTKGQKGTGLGLSMVYGIVKQSGGYIWAYSELGHGTSFKVYLPRVEEAEEKPALQPAPAGPPQGHETILVVEDEPQLRDLTRQFLEMRGYTVLVAEHGAAAIEVAQRHRGVIHLLLTDIIMPVMNGRELAQRMAALSPKTRILFMSGYTENAIWRNGMIENSNNFLQKPFTLDALTRKVREVLETPTPETEKSKMPLTKQYAIEAETGLPPRAPRFTLQLPVHYRLAGDTLWRHGTTENISRSGVLFRTDQPLEPNARLELSVELPTDVFGMAATEILCRGEIVRQADSAVEGMPPALAARILDYHFHRTGPIAEA
ncbi:MAG TPA: response regulator [Terriglobales bacterium]|nr:response regulator [Terriglobales bacterium]